MWRSLLVFLFLFILLTGCTALSSRSQYDGLAYFEFEACKAGDKYQVCKVRVIEGKEKDSVKVTATLPDGVSFTYEASNVKAFAGQALRADIEKAIVEQLGQVAPGVVDAIIKAIIGGGLPE